MISPCFINGNCLCSLKRVVKFEIFFFFFWSLFAAQVFKGSIFGQKYANIKIRGAILFLALGATDPSYVHVDHCHPLTLFSVNMCVLFLFVSLFVCLFN